MGRVNRIVFMGTPDFAVPSLEALVDADFDVVGVITAPDRRAGRGRTLRPSPVKEVAQRRGIEVLQPTNLKDPDFQQRLRDLQADLQVVVAFRMLPVVVWDMPPLGTINLHASMLPQYRGAAPINWVLMNGEPRTGATTFFLQHAIDTGDIIFREPIDLGPDETAGELHDRLMVLGADLVVRTVRAIDDGQVPQEPQAHVTEVKQAPKIDRHTCRIDWTRPAQQVHDHVRGLSPYPAAWTTFDGGTLKILRTARTDRSTNHTPGTLWAEEGHLFSACERGVVEVLELRPEGKRTLTARDFTNGFGSGPWRLGEGA